MNNHFSQFCIRVLVIEEEIVAHFLQRALFHLGHAPTIFKHPDEALQTFISNPYDFDAVITSNFERFDNTSLMTPTQFIDELFDIRPLPVLFWGVLKHSVSEDKHDLIAFLSKLKTSLNKNIVSEIQQWLKSIPLSLPQSSVPSNANPLLASKQDIYSDVFCLVYISKAHNHFTENDMMNILTSARKFNRTKRITGVLVYCKGYILQVLEGNFSAVNQLFNRIAQDPRHHSATLIFQGYLEHSQFPNWDMGFYGTANDNDFNLLGATNLDNHPANHFFKENIYASKMLDQKTLDIFGSLLS